MATASQCIELVKNLKPDTCPGCLHQIQEHDDWGGNLGYRCQFSNRIEKFVCPCLLGTRIIEGVRHQEYGQFRRANTSSNPDDWKSIFSDGY